MQLEGSVSRRRFLQNSLAIGATLSLPGAFAACGNEEDEAAPTGRTTATLRFIKGPHHPQDRRLLSGLAADFKREQPGITVNPSLYDWGNRDAQLTAAFASRQPPDVSYLTTESWTKFAEAGAIVDLSDRVLGDDFRETYSAIPSETWRLAEYRGKVWGVPIFQSVNPMFLNRDLLEQADATGWQESYAAWVDAARAVRRERPNAFGTTFPVRFADFAYSFWIPLVHNAGATFFNSDYTAGGFNTPEVAETWAFLRRMVEDRSAPAPGSYDFAGLQSLYKAGRSAIHWDVGGLAQDPPKRFDWDVDLAPPGPAAQTLGADFGFLCIAAKSSSQDAAWEFVKYFASADGVMSYIPKTSVGILPVRTDVSDRLIEAEPGLEKIMTELVPKVQGIPAHPKAIECFRQANEEFEGCMLGRKPAAQAVAAANDAVSRVLQG